MSTASGAAASAAAATSAAVSQTVMSPVVAKYNARAARLGSTLCVGLDPELSRLPERFQGLAQPLFAFNRWVIEQTAPYAAAFKCNSAFYEAHGARGWAELERTAEFLRAQVPDALLICDSKRADIGHTNRGYVQSVFDAMGFDAITLHPYLGEAALGPFLERGDKGCIVLCRTSNEGGEELQELLIDGTPLWRLVAERVALHWSRRGNCMLVVGAGHTGVMRTIREFAPEMPLLVPGIGAQGGEARAVVRAGLAVGSDRGAASGPGLIVSASRSILFSNDPAATARALAEEMADERRVVLEQRVRKEQTGEQPALERAR